jgi:tetrahydromethanopterin S-methyltransferase subunit F
MDVHASLRLTGDAATGMTGYKIGVLMALYVLFLPQVLAERKRAWRNLF